MNTDPKVHITVRLHELSEPMMFEALNAYTKGPMYCIRREDGSTLKFPLISIFTVKEVSL